MQSAGFFLFFFLLMKISFQITVGAVWMDTVQHWPVNCSSPDSKPAKRWQSAQWAECTKPSIYRAAGSWVKSHGEIMTAGGQVSDSWHLKWRIGTVTIINKLWKRISYCHPAVFSSGFEEMWCAVFQSGGRRKERQKHSLCVWTSCCPTDRTWNRSTGALQSDTRTQAFLSSYQRGR